MSKYTAYTGMGILVLITIVVVTMAAFSMGCTENGGNDSDLTGDLEIVESGTVFTESSSSGEISMEQNDLIVVKLKENPATGYSWNLTIPEGMELVGDDFVMAPEDESLAGAGGIHEWTLQAQTEGTYEISAIYKRDWENTTGDEDTFGMTVTVISSGEHDGEEDAVGDDTIVDEDDTEYIIRDAMVDDIEIFLMESFPLQVSVSATGYLPDGCTVIDEENIEVTMDGNTFDVALKTKRPADLMCTQALVPFEVNILLDVYGLEAGVYTVDVNGVTDTFEFTADNVIE